MLTIEKAINEIDFSINEISNRYYSPEGRCVPRVTEIISNGTNQEKLIIWANSLGLRGRRYIDELDKAAGYGSEAHSLIEDYLRDGKVNYKNSAFKSFIKWYDMVIDSVGDVEVLYIEESMANEWYGGTLDCLLKINNKIYLVDFKTSNHITEKYFLQLAAYRALIYTNLGISIDGCIILQLSKKNISFTEFTLDFSNPEHYKFIEECYRAFLSLLYSYYNTRYIASEFRRIFPYAS